MWQRNSLKEYGSSEDKIVTTVLSKNEGFLRRHLVLSSTVLGKLITTGVINDITHQKMNGKSNEAQVNILLNVLRQSGLRVFRKFIEVLRTSMDSWVADVILDTNITDAALKDTKYTLTDHLKNMETYHDDTQYPLPLGMQYEDSSGELFPDRHEINKRTISNLSEKMAVLRNLNKRGTGLVSSTQLDRMTTMFDNERQTQDSALTILRQEENAIRELLDQNLKEQSQIRRNQKSLFEIDKKLKQISLETSQLSSPLPRSNRVRERLLHIQRMPKPIKYETT